MLCIVYFSSSKHAKQLKMNIIHFLNILMDISHQIDVKLLHFCTIFLITPSMLLSVAVCTNQIQQKFDRYCSNSLEKKKQNKKINKSFGLSLLHVFIYCSVVGGLELCAHAPKNKNSQNNPCVWPHCLCAKLHIFFSCFFYHHHQISSKK